MWKGMGDLISDGCIAISVVFFGKKDLLPSFLIYKFPQVLIQF